MTRLGTPQDTEEHGKLTEHLHPASVHTWLSALRFLGILFTALTLAPALAHAFELPNKIVLSRTDYFTVQSIYRGWSFLGIFEAGAIIFTLILFLFVRRGNSVFWLTLLALTCLVAVQVLFWLFTFPANQQTNNWTIAPSDWMHLRNQWEYSHAARAGLSLVAFSALLLSVVHCDPARAAPRAV